MANVVNHFIYYHCDSYVLIVKTRIYRFTKNNIIFAVMKKPTIKDVASRACVSTALVSRVMNAPLNQDGLPDCVVHPDTARRILNAIAELGYHPNKAAVNLRKELKKRIGVIIPDISNPFFADIARHIEFFARKQGYIVLFGSTDETPEQLRTLAEAFIEDGVDGIIITPGIDSFDLVSKISSQGVPIVLTVRDIPGVEGVGRVLTDDASATDLAINHLISQRFDSIEMISPKRRLSNAKHREDLFAAKMAELGMPVRIHHQDSSRDALEDTKLILEDTIRRNVKALYCANASLPVRVLQAAKEMNIRIPEDIALFGYDGGLTYNILSPSISQIEFSREAIAKEAFAELTDMISQKTDSAGPKLIPPVLSLGDSTSITATRQNTLVDGEVKKLLSTLSKATLAINDAIVEIKSSAKH